MKCVSGVSISQAGRSPVEATGERTSIYSGVAIKKGQR